MRGWNRGVNLREVPGEYCLGGGLLVLEVLLWGRVYCWGRGGEQCKGVPPLEGALPGGLCYCPKGNCISWWAVPGAHQLFGVLDVSTPHS